MLIADDKELSVAGTSAALGARDGFELVGVALCADQAGEFAQATRPDVALVDAHLPGGGDAGVRAILTGSPETRVLARAGARDHDALIPMLEAGATSRNNPLPSLWYSASIWFEKLPTTRCGRPERS